MKLKLKGLDLGKNNARSLEVLFIGGYLPKDLIEYVELYSIAKEQTKSNILKEALEDWKKKNQESESDLLDYIIQRVRIEWRKIKSLGKKKINFEVFLNEVKKELSEKCSNDLYINLILSELINKKI